MTTKILAMVDALGNLIDFKLMPGQRNDICGVEPLIKDKEFDALLADKAFDADWLVEELTEMEGRQPASCACCRLKRQSVPRQGGN